MIDPSKISACFITKDSVYPKVIIDHISKFPFGEVLILTHSDSPHRKHELFQKAKFDLLYYNDDDAMCPIDQLLELSDPEKINLTTKERHFEAYKDYRTAVGFGWGCIFPKSILGSLKLYTDVYGEDEVYKRETERILMCLNFPQNRLVLPIIDLPSATAPDRLSMQPGHYSYIQTVEDRCKTLIPLS